MTDELLRGQEEAWLNPPEDEDETVELEVDPTDLPGYEED